MPRKAKKYDFDSFEKAYQEQHGHKIVRLYVLDPDNTVREVFDIREWNNRPRRIDSDGHVGFSAAVRHVTIGDIEVLTMFAEMEDECVKDTPEGPFTTFMYTLERHADLWKAVEKQIPSQGYARAWTWDEAMSQHKELVKTLRKVLKDLKTRDQQPVSAAG